MAPICLQEGVLSLIFPPSLQKHLALPPNTHRSMHTQALTLALETVVKPNHLSVSEGAMMSCHVFLLGYPSLPLSPQPSLG